jgi:hypothetical protein
LGSGCIILRCGIERVAWNLKCVNGLLRGTMVDVEKHSSKVLSELPQKLFLAFYLIKFNEIPGLASQFQSPIISTLNLCFSLNLHQNLLSNQSSDDKSIYRTVTDTNKHPAMYSTNLFEILLISYHNPFVNHIIE